MLREQWQRNLLGVVIAAFVSILGFNLVFPFLALYIRTLGNYDAGAAAFWTGVIGLVTGVVGAVAALVWGQLADRNGRKPMLLRATAGAAIGLVVMGIAANIWQLLLGRVMFSALAGTVPAANPLIAANTPVEHLSEAMGILQGSVYLSNTMGPLIGGSLATLVGYRASFIITASLYVASAVPAIFLVRERFVPPAVTRSLARAVTTDVTEVMSNRPIAYPIITALFALCAANVATPIISLLVQDLVGAGNAEKMAGLAFFAQGLAGAVAALTVGRIVARIGYRGLLRTTAPLGVAVYLLLWVAPNFATLAALLGLQGLIQGAQVPAINALIASRAPRHRAGAVFGVVSSINSIAFSGGPFLGGIVARSFGLRAVFPVSAVLVIGMLPLIGRATAEVRPVASQRRVAVPDES